MLAGNIDLANTLLDAADIRVPHGDLSVCYDSLGQLYQVPRYAYATPANAISEEEAAKIASSSKKEHVGPVVELAVTARIAPTATNQEQDVKIVVKSSATAGEVKQLLHETLLSGRCDQQPEPTNSKPNRWSAKGGLPPFRQRLMFCGRELGDGVHMQEAKLGDGGFLQVFVRPEAA